MMATKEKTGKFDCYANAAPDEPMFVLLARDPLAPLVVQMWADMKENLDLRDALEQVNEARELVREMDAYYSRVADARRGGRELAVLRARFANYIFAELLK